MNTIVVIIFVNRITLLLVSLLPSRPDIQNEFPSIPYYNPPITIPPDFFVDATLFFFFHATLLILFSIISYYHTAPDNVTHSELFTVRAGDGTPRAKNTAPGSGERRRAVGVQEGRRQGTVIDFVTLLHETARARVLPSLYGPRDVFVIRN